MSERDAGRSKRVAFLLAQVGAHVADRFAARIRELSLTPGEAAVLRLAGRTPGLSQRTIADRVGTVPSRIVALVDGLEQRGLLTRTRSATDRRNHELHLTDNGRNTLAALRSIAEAHEAEIRAGLTDEQLSSLTSTLQTLADAHGLDRDLHRHTAIEQQSPDSREPASSPSP